MSLRLAMVIAVLLAAACAVWWWIADTTQPAVHAVSAVPEARGRASETPTERSSTPTGAAGTGLTVHVVGAVAAPGVYHLAPGARVHEAVAAAGGATAEAQVDRLNLAAPVEDGIRIRVPMSGEPESPETGSQGPLPSSTSAAGGKMPAGGASAGRVNINTATAEELGSLPRVGPVLAQRIVDYRNAHGRFAAPEDLDAVSGVGPKMLESLLPLVTAR
ncbi:ComEA family DNA-binding protein [Sinomonas notoginsengisoli]|uniref:ComEA family DNA-binding protein n=1 Tax=Sinomonas notoginsengisoli TaxID=1457311 RepID=UPI001F466093|nr:helix-hairpin-helix domain-containing protein [Sinomonas notoginsengisoli]